MTTHKDVSTAFSRAPWGLLAPLVRVEVHLGSGLPAFAMVGLPEALREPLESGVVTLTRLKRTY